MRFVLWGVVASLLAVSCSRPTELARVDDLPPPTIRATEAAPAIDTEVTVEGREVTIRVIPEGFELAPAGSSVEARGHFHVLVDQSCFRTGTRIPQGDPDIHHVTSGEDHLTLRLSPGRHVLCTQIGDGFHTAINISASDEVVVS